MISLLFVFSVDYTLAQDNSDPGYDILRFMVNELDAIQDFRGIMVSRIYLDEEVEVEEETNNENDDSDDNFERKRVELRTGIMKSDTRSATSNLSHVDPSEYQEKQQVLNLIPWIYLPPDYGSLRRALPMKLRFDYDSPLQNITEIYQVQFIGEATYDEDEVYILQLSNPLITQRWYIDRENNNLLQVQVFNSSNIKLFNITYQDYQEYDTGIMLPTLIEVEDNNEKLMEIEYQNFEVNEGLTEEDFAQGFQDDYTMQIEVLKYELEENSEDDNLYWELSQLHYENDNLSEAISNLEKAIELDRKARYYAQMARYYRDRGEHQAALEELDKALGLDYGNGEYHYLQGEIKLRLRDLRQARHAFARAVARDNNNRQYLERLYSVKKTLGREEDDYFMDRAKRTADRLVELEPKNVSYRIDLGEAYFELKEFDKAAVEFKKAIDLAPDNSLAHVKLAQYYRAIDNYEKAEEIYNYVVYIDNTIRNHRRLADFYFTEKNYELAFQEYKKLKDRVREDNEIDLRLAQIYLIRGERERAFAMYKDLLLQDSSLLFKITDTIKEHSLDLAIDIYHLSLKEDLLEPEVKERLYSDLGYIYFQREKRRGELKLEELFKLDSRDQIYRQLGRTYFSLGNLDKSISYFKLIESRRPEDEYNLALAYLVVDNFDMAFAIGEELIEKDFSKKGEKIISLVTKLQEFRDEYDNEFVPGRIKRVEGDGLRRQGQLKTALSSYRSAIHENPEYKMSYFYSALINKVIANNLAYELALSGLETEQRELLNDLVVEFKSLNKF